MPFIAIALVIAAALGGGTAALAQQSLPGDVLWGFKVNVNENIAGALSASDTAKAEWDLSSIKTRLNEAQQLSEKGRLNLVAQGDIAANLKTHAEDITQVVTKLQTSGDTQGAADIAARYQAELAGAPSVDTQTAADTSADASLSAAVRNAFEQASSLSASTSAR